MSNHATIAFDGLHKAKAQAGLAAALPVAPDGLGDIYYASDTNTLYLTNTAGTAWVALSGGGGTSQVKVTSSDTTEGYLNGKLVAGAGITLTVGSPGGNETLSIASVPDASVVTYTPSTLADWNGSTDPGNVNGALNQLAARVKVLENNAGKFLTNASDGTYGYLEDKIVAGSNITLTVTGTTDKTITIDATGGGGGSDGEAQEANWARMGWDGVINANWLADGQLTTTATSLYTVPSSNVARISSIILNNRFNGPNTVRLYVDDGVSTYTVAYVDLPADATFEFVPKSPLILAATVELFGEADPNSNVDYWISGGIRTQPGSGVRPIVIFAGQPAPLDPLYTVPTGKKVIVTYISNHITDDPGTPNGYEFQIAAISTTGASARVLYNACQKYRDTLYFHPGIMLQDGDQLEGGTESSFGDLYICGWEADV